MSAPPTVDFNVVLYGPLRAGKRTCLRILEETFPPETPRGKIQTDWYARDFLWHVFTPSTLGLVDGARVAMACFPAAVSLAKPRDGHESQATRAPSSPTAVND